MPRAQRYRPSWDASCDPLVPATPLGDPPGLAQPVERGGEAAEVEPGARGDVVERGRLPAHGVEHGDIGGVGPGPRPVAGPDAPGAEPPRHTHTVGRAHRSPA